VTETNKKRFKEEERKRGRNGGTGRELERQTDIEMEVQA
jgi:hypothetical protein